MGNPRCRTFAAFAGLSVAGRLIWNLTQKRPTMRAPINLVLIAFAASVVWGANARGDTYTLDKQHTEVRFTWDHLGLSRQGGRFTDVTGTVNFDPEKPEASTVDVTIPLASISTGVVKLDEHLVNSREFFDAVTHPAILFKSTSVKMKSDRTGEMSGDLIINGISKPVVLEFVWNFTGEHPLANINPSYAGHYSSGFSAATQIRRSDWGIMRTIPYISDELKISIETEMHRDGPAPAPPPESGQPPSDQAVPAPEAPASQAP